MQNKRKLREIDPVILLSVIFVLIVLCLHHASYTIDGLKILREYQVTKLLQKFSVGGFLFLSGFKLAKSKLDSSFFQFIKSRFYRIYCLYLFALITFSFTVYPYSNQGTIPSFSNFIVHALCLQAIFPDYFQKDYLTIWFVSVLFCCYLFFLLTRKFLERTAFFSLLTIAISGLIIVIRFLAFEYNTILFVDYLDLWLALFGLGMIYSQTNHLVEQIKVKWLFIVSILCSILLILFYNLIIDSEQISLFNQVIERVLILLSIFPIYAIAFKISPQITVPLEILNLLKQIYYVSFCSFLFHRPIWTLMANLWSEESGYQFLYITVLGVPGIFFISYLIQKIYNQFIAAIMQKG